jgi:hypothetical protein
MSGIALGLKEALEPEKDEPAIVVQVSGEPIGERPVEAQLDERTPKESVVTIRPWLLPESEGDSRSALAAPVGTVRSWAAEAPPRPVEAPPAAASTVDPEASGGDPTSSPDRDPSDPLAETRPAWLPRALRNR